MASKILILFLFISSCGRDVSVSNTKLESISNVTQSDATTVDKEGTLLKSSSSDVDDQILTDTGTLFVSKYSSFNALEFIKAKADGSETPVTYRGEVKGKEVFLEHIEEK